MAHLLNLTGTLITVFEDDGVTRVADLPAAAPKIPFDFEPEVVAHAVDDRLEIAVPVVAHVFTIDEADLPPRSDGRIHVVGFPVLQAIADAGIDRDDFVAPDTSRASAVRGRDGAIVGVRRFRTL